MNSQIHVMEDFMKKQVLLALATLALVTLSCSLVSGMGGDTGDSEEPGSTPQVATDTVAPAIPQNTEAGPETINLSHPALYANDAYATYKMNMEIKYDGMDTGGNPKSFILVASIENQEQPKAQHVSISGEDAKDKIEFVIIGDQVLSVFPGMGCTVLPASSMEGPGPEESVPNIDGLLTGQAKRVETGVSIDGIITDRYKLTSENMTDPENSETPKVTDGSVYVAQDGGYIVRIEMNGKVNIAENDFDPNTETQVSLNYTFVPVEDGTMNITPPAECEEQLSGGSQYPVMEGAEGLVSMQDVVFYSVDATLEDVLNFYRIEMVDQGWTLSNDGSSSTLSFATLEFTRDGETVEVNAITSIDSVSVTVTKK